MSPHWINLGRQAFGLVDGHAIAAVVYWTPADVGELDDQGGEPVVTDPLFCLVRIESPDQHEVLLEGDEQEWSAALARAEDIYEEKVN